MIYTSKVFCPLTVQVPLSPLLWDIIARLLLVIQIAREKKHSFFCRVHASLLGISLVIWSLGLLMGQSVVLHCPANMPLALAVVTLRLFFLCYLQRTISRWIFDVVCF